MCTLPCVYNTSTRKKKKAQHQRFPTGTKIKAEFFTLAFKELGDQTSEFVWDRPYFVSLFQCKYNNVLCHHNVLIWAVYPFISRPSWLSPPLLSPLPPTLFNLRLQSHRPPGCSSTVPVPSCPRTFALAKPSILDAPLQPPSLCSAPACFSWLGSVTVHCTSR